MCIDYTDLNKAIPKKPFPLSGFDHDMDVVVGYVILCFLDACKGYHYIQMATEDIEKTTFVTDDGVFCYTRMSFRLKNAGTEFQKMVNKLFGNQINHNMEVYVNDLIIKSKKIRDLPIYMIETFQKIRAIGMKLNPKKCIFGVPSGKCLGFIVSKLGIEADLAKIKAIQE